MSELGFWFWFLAAALALNLAPGPDLIYVVSRALSHGWRIGIYATLGTCSGALLQLIAAALGLATLLSLWPPSLWLLQILGALYLLYLAWQYWHSPVHQAEISTHTPALSSVQAYWQGVMVDLFNPKVMLFFLAFLPQFIRPELGQQSLQFIGLGILVIMVSFVVEASAVLAANYTQQQLKQHPKLSRGLNRLLALTLCVIALRLVSASM